MVLKLLLIIAFWTTAILCDSRFVIMVKLNDLENYAVDLLDKKNFTTALSYEKDLSAANICSQLFETRSYGHPNTTSADNQDCSPTILDLNDDQKLSYQKQAEHTYNNWRWRKLVIGRRIVSLASFPCFDHGGQFKWIVAYDFNLQIGLLFFDDPNKLALPELGALIDSYSIVKLSSNGSDSNTASSSSSNPMQSTIETMFMDSLVALTEKRADDPLHDLDENSKFRLCSMATQVILENRGLKSINQSAEFKWTIENPDLNLYRPLQNSNPTAKIKLISKAPVEIDVPYEALYCRMLIQATYYGFYLSKDVMNPNRVFVIEGDNFIRKSILLEQMEVNWLENALNKDACKGFSKLIKNFIRTKSGRLFEN